MSGESDLPEMDTDPVDAEYEPVPPAADFVKKPETPKQGPGWLALGATGVLAALFGTGAGAVLGDRGQTDYAPETLVSDVQVIAEGQLTQESRTVEMLEELDTRLRREISSVAAGRGDDNAIASLTAQMTAISDQLEAFEVAQQEADGGEGFDFDRVLARLESLETLDEDEVASPRVANRAIRSAQRRMDELEADLATRSDAMLNLVSRLETVEEGLTTTGTDAGEAIAPDALEALRADIEALKAAASSETPPVQTEEIEELRSLLQDLREGEIANSQALSERGAGQTAAFSMLSIEAAAREGQPFQTAFARLEEALPGNRSVAKLKPLAARGAPTMARLQAGFSKARTEAAALAAQSKDGSGDGWSWVRQALGEAVVVRRAGDKSGEGTQETVGPRSFEVAMEAAELRLAVRDLEGAIGAVETLADPIRAPFEDWLVDALARQKLEDGLGELRLTLMDAGR